MSIVVVGSVAFDNVVTRQATALDTLGGSALYFSAAASLFEPVHMVAVVGDDFPMDELTFLEQRGVDLSGLAVKEGGKTFRWCGEYELDMNKRQTTNLELNVFSDFDPVLSEDARKSEYVFLGNIQPELQLKVLDQVRNPVFVAADTIECYIQDNADAFREMLGRIDCMFINDAEAMLFTGESTLIGAARAILECGPKYVVLKKGEHGSLVVSADNLFVVPAYPLENVVDPTGAGDTYAGATLGWLAQGGRVDYETLKTAVVYGGLVASFVCEDFSIEALRDLTLDDIDQRFQRFRANTAY
jgi:cytidine kinase